jgi:2-oxoglutarate ferredoxin oxidoreductase subunit alpha
LSQSKKPRGLGPSHLHRVTASELSIAITGAGGAGVISVGELLLQAWAALGGRGLLRKAFGPQIRGGESAALLKLSDHERYTAADRCDVLLALDWENFTRFGDEIRLHGDSLVICADATRMPEAVRSLVPAPLQLPIAELTRAAHGEGRENMFALGLLGRLLELPEETLVRRATGKLARKAEVYREAAQACIAAGERGWYASGNQAAAYAALRAGIRFVAAYPITPGVGRAGVPGSTPGAPRRSAGAGRG